MYQFSEKQLLERRAQLYDDMQLLTDVAKHEKRNFTADEAQTWNAKMRETLAITDQIKEINDDLLQPTFTGEKKTGDLILEGMRALYRNEQTRAFTLAGTTATITNPSVSTDWFLTLKAQNPLFKAGARLLSTRNYTQWPVETTAPAVVWFDEGDTMTPDSTGVIGSKKVTYRTASILINASNFWLEDSEGDIGGAIISKMATDAINEAIGKVCLNGVSANGQPVGLDSVANVQTVAAGGALTNYSKPIEAVRKLLAANVEREKIHAIMSPQGWEQMQLLADQNDQFLMAPPGIADIPQHVTSAVLENYGTDPNFTTRMYLGDFSNMLVAAEGPRIQILKERFADKFETGFLVHLRIDMQVLRPTTFCRIEGIAV